jgi:hypothetical protein
MTKPVGSGKETASPDARAVMEFHRNDDLNGRPESHHHDLGTGRNQASPGSHNHDGITSIAILAGVTFTGSRGSNTADIINQICNALSAMGAVNNTNG